MIGRYIPPLGAERCDRVVDSQRHAADVHLNPSWGADKANKMRLRTGNARNNSTRILGTSAGCASDTAEPCKASRQELAARPTMREMLKPKARTKRQRARHRKHRSVK